MSFFIGNVKINSNVILAPMAGISNSTFRTICKEMGSGLVVTELISDKAIVYGSKKTFDLLKFKEQERPIAIQLFGGDAESMANAAKIVETKVRPDIIDLNIGCPVPKVAIKNHAGSGLLRTPEKIREIVSAVVKAVSVPVTVKMRIGWDEEHINAVEVAKICEEAGASAIFVHGRTRAQGYSGKANWQVIKEVVESVSIPVIGNGDITSCYDAKKMMDETGCTAVMIGRGVLGNPWLIKECVDYLENGKIPESVSIVDKITMMRRVVNDLIEEKGEKTGVLELRSNLMYYFKGMPNTKEIKLKICTCQSKDEFLSILDEYQKLVED